MQIHRFCDIKAFLRNCLVFIPENPFSCLSNQFSASSLLDAIKAPALFPWIGWRLVCYSWAENHCKAFHKAFCCGMFRLSFSIVLDFSARRNTTGAVETLLQTRTRLRAKTEIRSHILHSNKVTRGRLNKEQKSYNGIRIKRDLNRGLYLERCGTNET